MAKLKQNGSLDEPCICRSIGHTVDLHTLYLPNDFGTAAEMLIGRFFFAAEEISVK